MNETFSKKSKAYLRIKKVLAEYPTAVASNPTLLAVGVAFQNNLDLVEGIQVPEVNATIPNTKFKNARFLAFAEELLPVCNGLQLYANATLNMVLAGQVPIYLSNLMDGDEVSQVHRFWTVVNAAKAITPADLVPYGITAADLTALETNLTSLETLVDSPRSAIDARMVKRQLQEKAFRQMDTFLLTTLDLAVRTRKAAFPEFVAAYFLARKLHEGGGGTTETGNGANPKEVAAMPSSEELQLALSASTGQPAMNGVH
ncbi:MAG: hypothetical protein K9J37_02515 [Saprospiraceae bacterium]|nr:hypothetical protein [Saprospiraceae bacterium]MCF8248753.1 hypothetical protein [Saprospiraceae bacterium]MCF8278757.1 hypothetical protein [Bacteroidales bacterium]MCF8310557.1 hypothetical protein [Saprospiraceae bacterium]MCF8439116.1 hypothetical protein [Saprospiraceae bacterium]